MTDAPAEFESYWEGVLEDVEALSMSPVEIEELPIRSNEVSTTYAVRFQGVGGYPLFAYYTTPLGDGPFPALFQAPNYGSVVTVPAFERRRRYAVLALCHRGQRLSDSRYSAAYPGLLTDGLPGLEAYRWREIAADCLRALDVLVAQPQADSTRLATVGNDMTAITAALRPQVGFLLLNGQMLFRDIPTRLDGLHVYPLQEYNDYLRSHPQERQTVAHTLSLFDPIAFAPRIDALTLVTCEQTERPSVEPLVEALSGKATLSVRSGYGYLDHELEESWLARVTGA